MPDASGLSNLARKPPKRSMGPKMTDHQYLRPIKHTTSVDGEQTTIIINQIRAPGWGPGTIGTNELKHIRG